jgi:hypothetical protein
MQTATLARWSIVGCALGACSARSGDDGGGATGRDADPHAGTASDTGDLDAIDGDGRADGFVPPLGCFFVGDPGDAASCDPNGGTPALYACVNRPIGVLGRGIGAARYVLLLFVRRIARAPARSNGSPATALRKACASRAVRARRARGSPTARAAVAEGPRAS